MRNPTEALAQSCCQEAIHLLSQCLMKTEHCLNQLTEEQVWFRTHETANSIGNLILHLAGNLNQWAVSGVGGQSDTRSREQEFAARGDTTKNELLVQLKVAVQDASEVIQSLSQDDWLKPLQIQGFQVNAYAAIAHTTSHFVGHTHQIIFITRMILGEHYQFHWTPDSDRGHVPI